MGLGKPSKTTQLTSPKLVTSPVTKEGVARDNGVLK